jgi:hypothetical protein
MLLLALVVAAGLGACTRRVASRLRWLAGAAVVVFGLGLLTPQYLLHGIYASLWSNFRYLLPGLTLAVVVATTMLTTTELANVRSWAWKYVVVAFALTAATYWDLPILNTTLHQRFIDRPWRTTAASLAIAAAVGVVTIHRPTPLGVRARRAVSVGCASVAVLALVLARPSSVDHRYDFEPEARTLYAWAHDHRGRRIAVEPFDFAELIRLDRTAPEDGKRMLLFTYPLYGPDGANDVESIATIRDHRVALPESCHAWWQALARRRITDVVVWLPPGAPVTATPLGRWTARAPSTRLVLRSRLAAGRHGSLALLSVDSTQPPPC